ncbi:MAG: M20/M25/M40 family metallo-hydrolase [Bacteroidota bacterium]|nr:M20/M25/M40 family metallo-hydrolase [Bacteroidota bacterium]
MRRLNVVLIFIFLSLTLLKGQDEEKVLRALYDEALTNHEAYENLRYLCKNTAGRIAGTPEAAAAVEFTKQVLSRMNLDSVYLQELVVPHWERGNIEYAMISSSKLGSTQLNISALGKSIGTGKTGITARLVEVKSFDELGQLGEKGIKGKIVFFNRPMDPKNIQTFQAYGAAVSQRTQGAAEAARYGAIGAIVRSVTTARDDFPHTGVMYYKDGIAQVPAVSVSTNDADLLSEWFKQDPELYLHFVSTCRNLPDETSYNVVGEIRGVELPDQIITIGAHLDAWDSGEGAHDDGAGCIQSIEVLRLFKMLGIQPKRTIRAVMFMDEEIGQSGARKYAELAGVNSENHYAAIESDRGALTPMGFGFGAEGERLEALLALQKYFDPYKMKDFRKGGGGADIGPLSAYDALLISFIPDIQRYFDFHHSPNDTFEQVNERELQMGSAAIAALIYLIDKYDL